MKPAPFRALLIIGLSSCAGQLTRVKPSERGVLAKPMMSNDRDSLQTTMTQHAYFSREGTFGGGGVGGGGCGCN